jgi:hypothetical protein
MKNAARLGDGLNHTRAEREKHKSLQQALTTTLHINTPTNKK